MRTNVPTNYESLRPASLADPCEIIAAQKRAAVYSETEYSSLLCPEMCCSCDRSSPVYSDPCHSNDRSSPLHAEPCHYHNQSSLLQAEPWPSLDDEILCDHSELSDYYESHRRPYCQENCTELRQSPSCFTGHAVPPNMLVIQYLKVQNTQSCRDLLIAEIVCSSDFPVLSW